MEQAPKPIDSESSGDPSRHCTLAHLERVLAELRPAPGTDGRLVLVVRRGDGGRRESLDHVLLTPEGGVPGDGWGRRNGPLPEAQLTVMERDVAELIANGQPLALFGDNLFVHLDLSVGSLPTASRVRIGDAILEVTPKAHNGCRKFLARFGEDALRFVSRPELRHRNLRGIYMRVVEAGAARVGDRIEVIMRAAPAPPE